MVYIIQVDLEGEAEMKGEEGEKRRDKRGEEGE